MYILNEIKGTAVCSPIKQCQNQNGDNGTQFGVTFCGRLNFSFIEVMNELRKLDQFIQLLLLSVGN